MNNKFFKRFLALVLSVIMFLTTFPAGCISVLAANVVSGQVKVSNGTSYSVGNQRIFGLDKNGKKAQIDSYNKSFAANKTGLGTQNLLKKYINTGNNGGRREPISSDVPIYRISRSYGLTSDEKNAKATTTFQIEEKSNLQTFREAVKKDGITLTKDKAQKIYWVLQNSLKQFTAEKGTTYYEEELYFLAGQCLIWEIEEGKRTGFSNDTKYSNTGSSSYPTNAAKLSRNTATEKSYSGSTKNRYYWHDYYYTIKNKYFSSIKTDYYQEILDVAELQSKEKGLEYISSANSGMKYKSATVVSTDTDSYQMPYVSSDDQYKITYTFTEKMVGETYGKYDVNNIVLPIRNVDGLKLSTWSTKAKKTVTLSYYPTSKSSTFTVASGTNIDVLGITKNSKYYYVRYKKGDTNTYGYLLKTDASTVLNSIPTSSNQILKCSASENKVTFYTTAGHYYTTNNSSLTIYWHPNAWDSKYYNTAKYFSGKDKADDGISVKGYICGGNNYGSMAKMYLKLAGYTITYKCAGPKDASNETIKTQLIPKGYDLKAAYYSEMKDKHPATHNTKTNGKTSIEYSFSYWTMPGSTDHIAPYEKVEKANKDYTFIMHLKKTEYKQKIYFKCAICGATLGSGEHLYGTPVSVPSTANPHKCSGTPKFYATASTDTYRVNNVASAFSTQTINPSNYSYKFLGCSKQVISGASVENGNLNNALVANFKTTPANNVSTISAGQSGSVTYYVTYQLTTTENRTAQFFCTLPNCSELVANFTAPKGSSKTSPSQSVHSVTQDGNCQGYVVFDKEGNPVDIPIDADLKVVYDDSESNKSIYKENVYEVKENGEEVLLGVKINLEDVDIQLMYWDNNPDSYIAKSTKPSGVFNPGSTFQIASNDTKYYAKYQITLKTKVNFVCAYCGENIAAYTDNANKNISLSNITNAETAFSGHDCQGFVEIEGTKAETEDTEGSESKEDKKLTALIPADKLFKYWSTDSVPNSNKGVITNTSDIKFPKFGAVTYYANASISKRVNVTANSDAYNDYQQALEAYNRELNEYNESEVKDPENEPEAPSPEEYGLSDWESFCTSDWSVEFKNSSNLISEFHNTPYVEGTKSCYASVNTDNQLVNNSLKFTINNPDYYIEKVQIIDFSNNGNQISKVITPSKDDIENDYNSFYIPITASSIDDVNVVVTFKMTDKKKKVNIHYIALTEEDSVSTSESSEPSYTKNTEIFNRSIELGLYTPFTFHNGSEPVVEYLEDGTEVIRNDPYYRAGFLHNGNTYKYTGYYGVYRDTYEQYKETVIDKEPLFSELDKVFYAGDMDIYLYYYLPRDGIGGISYTLNVDNKDKIQGLNLDINDVSLYLYRSENNSSSVSDYKTFNKDLNEKCESTFVDYLTSNAHYAWRTEKGNYVLDSTVDPDTTKSLIDLNISMSNTWIRPESWTCEACHEICYDDQCRTCKKLYCEQLEPVKSWSCQNIDCLNNGKDLTDVACNGQIDSGFELVSDIGNNGDITELFNNQKVEEDVCGNTCPVTLSNLVKCDQDNNPVKYTYDYCEECDMIMPSHATNAAVYVGGDDDQYGYGYFLTVKTKPCQHTNQKKVDFYRIQIPLGSTTYPTYIKPEELLNNYAWTCLDDKYSNRGLDTVCKHIDGYHKTLDIPAKDLENGMGYYYYFVVKDNDTNEYYYYDEVTGGRQQYKGNHLSYDAICENQSTKVFSETYTMQLRDASVATGITPIADTEIIVYNPKRVTIQTVQNHTINWDCIKTVEYTLMDYLEEYNTENAEYNVQIEETGKWEHYCETTATNPTRTLSQAVCPDCGAKAIRHLASWTCNICNDNNSDFQYKGNVQSAFCNCGYTFEEAWNLCYASLNGYEEINGQKKNTWEPILNNILPLTQTRYQIHGYSHSGKQCVFPNDSTCPECGESPTLNEDGIEFLTTDEKGFISFNVDPSYSEDIAFCIASDVVSIDEKTRNVKDYQYYAVTKGKGDKEFCDEAVLSDRHVYSTYSDRGLTLDSLYYSDPYNKNLSFKNDEDANLLLCDLIYKPVKVVLHGSSSSATNEQNMFLYSDNNNNLVSPQPQNFNFKVYKDEDGNGIFSDNESIVDDKLPSNRVYNNKNRTLTFDYIPDDFSKLLKVDILPDKDKNVLTSQGFPMKTFRLYSDNNVVTFDEDKDEYVVDFYSKVNDSHIQKITIFDSAKKCISPELLFENLKNTELSLKVYKKGTDDKKILIKTFGLNPLIDNLSEKVSGLGTISNDTVDAQQSVSRTANYSLFDENDDYSFSIKADYKRDALLHTKDTSRGSTVHNFGYAGYFYSWNGLSKGKTYFDYKQSNDAKNLLSAALSKYNNTVNSYSKNILFTISDSSDGELIYEISSKKPIVVKDTTDWNATDINFGNINEKESDTGFETLPLCREMSSDKDNSAVVDLSNLNVYSALGFLIDDETNELFSDKNIEPFLFNSPLPTVDETCLSDLITDEKLEEMYDALVYYGCDTFRLQDNYLKKRELPVDPEDVLSEFAFGTDAVTCENYTFPAVPDLTYKGSEYNGSYFTFNNFDEFKDIIDNIYIDTDQYIGQHIILFRIKPTTTHKFTQKLYLSNELADVVNKYKKTNPKKDFNIGVRFFEFTTATTNAFSTMDEAVNNGNITSKDATTWKKVNSFKKRKIPLSENFGIIDIDSFTATGFIEPYDIKYKKVQNDDSDPKYPKDKYPEVVIVDYYLSHLEDEKYNIGIYVSRCETKESGKAQSCVFATSEAISVFDKTPDEFCSETYSFALDYPTTEYKINVHNGTGVGFNRLNYAYNSLANDPSGESKTKMPEFIPDFTSSNNTNFEFKLLPFINYYDDAEKDADCLQHARLVDTQTSIGKPWYLVKVKEKDPATGEVLNTYKEYSKDMSLTKDALSLSESKTLTIEPNTYISEPIGESGVRIMANADGTKASLFTTTPTNTSVYEFDLYYGGPYTVNTTIKNGTISPSKNDIDPGDDYNVEFTPDDGYTVSYIKVDDKYLDCNDYLEGGSYLFENIDKDHSIEVFCEKIAEINIYCSKDSYKAMTMKGQENNPVDPLSNAYDLRLFFSNDDIYKSLDKVLSEYSYEELLNLLDTIYLDTNDYQDILLNMDGMSDTEKQAFLKNLFVTNVNVPFTSGLVENTNTDGYYNKTDYPYVYTYYINSAFYDIITSDLKDSEKDDVNIQMAFAIKSKNPNYYYCVEEPNHKHSNNQHIESGGFVEISKASQGGTYNITCNTDIHTVTLNITNGTLKTDILGYGEKDATFATNKTSSEYNEEYQENINKQTVTLKVFSGDDLNVDFNADFDAYVNSIYLNNVRQNSKSYTNGGTYNLKNIQEDITLDITCESNPTIDIYCSKSALDAMRADNAFVNPIDVVSNKYNLTYTFISKKDGSKYEFNTKDYTDILSVDADAQNAYLNKKFSNAQFNTGLSSVVVRENTNTSGYYNKTDFPYVYTYVIPSELYAALSGNTDDAKFDFSISSLSADEYDFCVENPYHEKDDNKHSQTQNAGYVHPGMNRSNSHYSIGCYAKTYNVSAEIVNGTITPNQTDVIANSNVSITFKPNDGYVVSSIKVDGEDIDALSYIDGGTYKFNRIRKDHDIKVECEKMTTVNVYCSADAFKYSKDFRKETISPIDPASLKYDFTSYYDIDGSLNGKDVSKLTSKDFAVLKSSWLYNSKDYTDIYKASGNTQVEQIRASYYDKATKLWSSSEVKENTNTSGYYNKTDFPYVYTYYISSDMLKLCSKKDDANYDNANYYFNVNSNDDGYVFCVEDDNTSKHNGIHIESDGGTSLNNHSEGTIYNIGCYVKKYDLTTKITNGTITPSETNILHGDKRTVTFEPNTGYVVSSIKVDNKKIDISEYYDGGDYNFTNYVADHTVEITCEKPVKINCYMDANAVKSYQLQGVSIDKYPIQPSLINMTYYWDVNKMAYSTSITSTNLNNNKAKTTKLQDIRNILTLSESEQKDKLNIASDKPFAYPAISSMKENTETSGYYNKTDFPYVTTLYVTSAMADYYVNGHYSEKSSGDVNLNFYCSKDSNKTAYTTYFRKASGSTMSGSVNSVNEGKVNNINPSGNGSQGYVTYTGKKYTVKTIVYNGTTTTASQSVVAYDTPVIKFKPNDGYVVSLVAGKFGKNDSMPVADLRERMNGGSYKVDPVTSNVTYYVYCEKATEVNVYCSKTAYKSMLRNNETINPADPKSGNYSILNRFYVNDSIPDNIEDMTYQEFINSNDTKNSVTYNTSDYTDFYALDKNQQFAALDDDYYYVYPWSNSSIQKNTNTAGVYNSTDFPYVYTYYISSALAYQMYDDLAADDIDDLDEFTYYFSVNSNNEDYYYCIENPRHRSTNAETHKSTDGGATVLEDVKGEVYNIGCYARSYDVRTSITNGKITGNQIDMEPNTDVTIEFTPDKGYAVTSVKIDGTAIDYNKYVSGGSYTFENISKDHKIDVTCARATMINIFCSKDAVKYMQERGETINPIDPASETYELCQYFDIDSLIKSKGIDLKSTTANNLRNIFQRADSDCVNMDSSDFIDIYQLSPEEQISLFRDELGLNLSLPLTTGLVPNTRVSGYYNKEDFPYIYSYCTPYELFKILYGTEDDVDVSADYYYGIHDLGDYAFCTETPRHTSSNMSDHVFCDGGTQISNSSSGGTYDIGCYSHNPNRLNLKIEFIQPNNGPRGEYSYYSYNTNVYSTFMIENNTDVNITDLKPAQVKYSYYITMKDRSGNIVTKQLPNRVKNDFRITYTYVDYSGSSNVVVPATSGGKSGQNIFTIKKPIVKKSDFEKLYPGCTFLYLTPYAELVYLDEDTGFFGNAHSSMSEKVYFNDLDALKYIEEKDEYDLNGGKNFAHIDPENDKEYHNKVSWEEYTCKDGVFEKKQYTAKITFDKLKLYPAHVADASNPTAKKKSNSTNEYWETKSGYGLWAEIIPKTNYSGSSKSIITYVQSAEAYLPEKYYNNADGLKMKLIPNSFTNGSINNCNDYSEILRGGYSDYEKEGTSGFSFGKDTNGSLAHHVPVWYPDETGYALQVKISDTWTPAGMLSYVGDTNEVMVNGSVFDDYRTSETSGY